MGKKRRIEIFSIKISTTNYDEQDCINSFNRFFLVFTANYVSAESGEESEKWLADNAKEEGVITLPSGLQYKVLRKGDGADYPTVDSPCKCHYKGTLIDGTQFDSSYDRGTPPKIQGGQALIFTMEIIEITGGRKPAFNC